MDGRAGVLPVSEEDLSFEPEGGWKVPPVSEVGMALEAGKSVRLVPRLRLGRSEAEYRALVLNCLEERRAGLEVLNSRPDRRYDSQTQPDK